MRRAGPERRWRRRAVLFAVLAGLFLMHGMSAGGEGCCHGRVVATAASGTYRFYASFATKGADANPVALVLSSPITVAGTGTGAPATGPLPSASTGGVVYTASITVTAA